MEMLGDGLQLTRLNSLPSWGSLPDFLRNECASSSKETRISNCHWPQGRAAEPWDGREEQVQMFSLMTPGLEKIGTYSDTSQRS